MFNEVYALDDPYTVDQFSTGCCKKKIKECIYLDPQGDPCMTTLKENKQ